MKKLQITFLALLLTGTIFSCREKEEEFIKTTNPEVSITNYQGGETVHSIITIEIEATDTEGVEKVEVYVNGDLAETLTAQPYAIEINTFSYEDGPLQIKVEAHDAYGNKGMVERALIVDNVLLTFTTLNLNKRFEGVSYNEDVFHYLVITGEKEGEEVIIFETEMDDFQDYVIARPEWYHEDYYNYTYAIRRTRENFLNPQFSSDNIFITSYPKLTAKNRVLGTSPSTGGSTPLPEPVGEIVVTYSAELQALLSFLDIWSANSGTRSSSIVDGKRYDRLPVRNESVELFANLTLSDNNFREYIAQHQVGDTVELDFENTQLLDKKSIQIGTSNSWSLMHFRTTLSNNSFFLNGILQNTWSHIHPGKTEIDLPISSKVDYNFISFTLNENNVSFRTTMAAKSLPNSFERLSADYEVKPLGNDQFEIGINGDFTYATLTESAGPTNNKVDLYHIIDKDASGKYITKRPLLSDRLAQVVAEFGYDNLKPIGLSTILDTRVSKYSETFVPITNTGDYKQLSVNFNINLSQSQTSKDLEEGIERHILNY